MLNQGFKCRMQLDQSALELLELLQLLLEPLHTVVQYTPTVYSSCIVLVSIHCNLGAGTENSSTVIYALLNEPLCLC